MRKKVTSIDVPSVFFAFHERKWWTAVLSMKAQEWANG